MVVLLRDDDQGVASGRGFCDCEGLYKLRDVGQASCHQQPLELLLALLHHLWGILFHGDRLPAAAVLPLQAAHMQQGLLLPWLCGPAQDMQAGGVGQGPQSGSPDCVEDAHS